ncbi:MAG TPA: SRPBCC domain-containing protein [Nitrospiria bacterium]|nr:SRPBCC domain-containing protein [Nitrospiria bacterium]
MPEKKAESTADREIVISRVFDAPRRLVFRAWTQPEHLMRWWAPKGCTTPVCTVDLRPGGVIHYCMRLPEGREIWGLGIYREIVESERIVYTDSFADADGKPVPPSYYGMSEGHPSETMVTVTFAEREGKTTLMLVHSIPATVEERGGTEQGWNEMFDRLVDVLNNMPGETGHKP